MPERNSGSAGKRLSRLSYVGGSVDNVINSTIVFNERYSSCFRVTLIILVFPVSLSSLSSNTSHISLVLLDLRLDFEDKTVKTFEMDNSDSNSDEEGVFVRRPRNFRQRISYNHMQESYEYNEIQNCWVTFGVRSRTHFAIINSRVIVIVIVIIIIIIIIIIHTIDQVKFTVRRVVPTCTRTRQFGYPIIHRTGVILHTSTSEYLASRFHNLSTYHNLYTRSQHDTLSSVPLHRTSAYSSSFTIDTIRSWNSLSTDVRGFRP
ncbi:hypothetical protein ANN_00729 [Periplaneta americana]|uniref:Uncharacterized protein n=1 Tax=Periplaneta americana TaxID=6978 RepID=A0ABQ8TTA5_PERAM|nr:hypothetical protein ANN_00729 [Periplaneta americana]